MSFKVLIVSRNAWDNKSGNTLSNFFQDFKIEELAQIFCRDELPDNELCDNYYCISEKKLLKSVITRRNAGTVVKRSDINSNTKLQHAAETGNKLYSLFRHYRFTLLLWFRELVWLTGKWKSSELDDFIIDFKPDIIFSTAYDSFYTYNVLNYVRKIAKVPYVLFHCDDQLTYRKFSLSPLFWANRFILRGLVTKAIKKASINYCIIDEQQRVYNSIVPASYKILNKCGEFNGVFEVKNIHKPIRMIYAGNLHVGRWKTLQKLAEAIKVVNNEEERFILDIYTGKTVSERKISKIAIHPTILIHDYIPYNQLVDIQMEADILLHVESFNIKERLITFLSFSTKIVDFFELGKCIMAIGWEKSAPLKYLKDKDAALVITNTKEIPSILIKLLDEHFIIRDYSLKARQCGQNYHDKEKVLPAFKSDLKNIVS